MIKIIIHSIQQSNNNKYREILIKDSNITDERRMVQIMLSYLYDYIYGNDVPDIIFEQIDSNEIYTLYGNILQEYGVWDL